MALLRTSRLWIGAFWPSKEDLIPLDEVGTLATHIYTVPTGFRAVIRCVTIDIQDIPSGELNAQASLWIGHDGWVRSFKFWWGWFQPGTAVQGQWNLHQQFDGIVVLHSEDKIYFSSTSTQDTHCVGSGALLPEY